MLTKKCIILVSCALLACTNTPRNIPVFSRTEPDIIKIITHKVKKNETLYSIAWQYNSDYQLIVRNNTILSPYIIHPGQILKITITADQETLNTNRKPPIDTKLSATPPNNVISKRISTHETKQKLQNWIWPTNGKIIENYSETKGKNTFINKGIDISGKTGDDIRVTAKGVVVYSGSGLTGYGNLIIVKHNEEYLSAYAHNKINFVKEDDKVTIGQKIAELGSSGAQSPRLHFEIRRNGKPVNPLLYLPTR